jgi:YD repeat-containing protein
VARYADDANPGAPGQAPGGNTTTWVFDNADRVISETNALSAVRSWVYDTVGNVTAQTDRNGRLTNFSVIGRFKTVLPHFW